MERVVTHQSRNGSRTTRTRFPERINIWSSFGILRSVRLFWVVPHAQAPPVSSSIREPAKTGGRDALIAATAAIMSLSLNLCLRDEESVTEKSESLPGAST
jgi:hypothetical protein